MASVWRCLSMSLLVAGVLWAQGLIVCGKCGREARAGDAVCRHCKEALPKPKADTPTAVEQPTAQADDKAEVGRLAAGIVEANVRLARELEAKQPELALCYYQNAMALMRLAGEPSRHCERSDSDGRARALSLVQRGTVPCKRCNGSGRYQLDLSKVDSSKGSSLFPACPCKAGTLPGLRRCRRLSATLAGADGVPEQQMVAGDAGSGAS